MQRIPGGVLLLLIIWTVRSARHSDSSQERHMLFGLAGLLSGIFVYQLYLALR